MGWNIAVVGVNEMAGREVLKILAERDFPVGKVVALAEGHEMGRSVSFGEKDLKIQSADDFDFSGIQMAFFAGDSRLALRYAGAAVAAGAVVIDGTGHFAQDSKVPLVVPEINPESMKDLARFHIVASPSPAAIFLAMVLAPLAGEVGLEQVVATCMVPVSVAGTPGMDELFAQTRTVFMNSRMQGEVFPRQVAFNLLPQVGGFGSDGLSDAEHRLVVEGRRLLGDKVQIGAHFIQAPVFIGESLALTVGFGEALTPGSARKYLSRAPGIKVVDRLAEGGYATPVECAGEDDVFVSRIRKDMSLENGLAMFVVSDNSRKGGALNMVQIAEVISGNMVMKD
ncbi:MAG: hypothetical protein A2018_01440 [Alphaproteobacteria bacterium GWF2_58_20]|nr:MAG: hypothetical protein A2018_01440 [Alphaproteobacteria bacterium GWF2_58_20]